MSIRREKTKLTWCCFPCESHGFRLCFIEGFLCITLPFPCFKFSSFSLDFVILLGRSECRRTLCWGSRWCGCTVTRAGPPSVIPPVVASLSVRISAAVVSVSVVSIAVSVSVTVPIPISVSVSLPFSVPVPLVVVPGSIAGPWGIAPGWRRRPR